MKPLALYRLLRRRLHRRAVLAQRRRIRSLLAIRVEDDKERFDERSTIDRFRRESGQR